MGVHSKLAVQRQFSKKDNMEIKKVSPTFMKNVKEVLIMTLVSRSRWCEIYAKHRGLSEH